MRIIKRIVISLSPFMILLHACGDEEVLLSGSMSGSVYIDEGLTLLEEEGDVYVGLFSPAEAEVDDAIPYTFYTIPAGDWTGIGEYSFERVPEGEYVVKGLLDRDLSSEGLDNPWPPNHGDVTGRYEYTAGVEPSLETTNIEVPLSSVFWDDIYDFNGQYVYYGVEFFHSCGGEFTEREGFFQVDHSNIDMKRISDKGVSMEGIIDYNFYYLLEGYYGTEEVTYYEADGHFLNDFTFRENLTETLGECTTTTYLAGVDMDSPEPAWNNFDGTYYVTEIETVDTCDTFTNTYSNKYVLDPYYNWAMNLSDNEGSHFFGVLKNDGAMIEGIGIHQESDGTKASMSFMGNFGTFTSNDQLMKSINFQLWIYQSNCWKALEVSGWGYFGE